MKTEQKKVVNTNPYKTTLWAIVEAHNINYWSARVVLDRIFKELVLDRKDFNEVVAKMVKTGEVAMLKKIRDAKLELKKYRGEIATSNN